MTETSGPTNAAAESNDAESVAVEAEQQENQEARTLGDERLSMDPTDMADAIDHEKDQKWDGSSETRYEDDVDEALPDDSL